MGSSRAPAIIAGVALVAAVVIFFVVSGSDDDESTTATTSTVAETTVPESTIEEDPGGGIDEGGGGNEPKPEPDKPEIETIVIKNGEPVGGVAELAFEEGDSIRFAVESDVADEIHLHGYDVTENVEAGGSVEFDVPATLTGVFEAELHNALVPIAEITVNPS